MTIQEKIEKAYRGKHLFQIDDKEMWNELFELFKKYNYLSLSDIEWKLKEASELASEIVTL